MKILYIIESLMSGGKERRLVSLIKEIFIKENVEIEFIILSNEIHYKEILDLDIKIHYFERNIKKDIRILFRFNKVLNKFKPKIVHCWDNIASFHFAPICYFKNIPFVNSMISTAPPLNFIDLFSKRFLFTAVSYPFSTIILSNSRAGLLSYRVPKRKGRFIYNGFDMERTKVKNTKENIRKKFKIDKDKVIGMTASFSKMKDYKTFVRAGEKILERRDDIAFVAIGDGHNLKTIKKYIKKKYLKNFFFVGKQTDVESIVNIFDIGVLSTYTEGISNAVMEYMALAKPVIATNGGGTDELVVNNETGFLIEKENYEELADRIEFLLSNLSFSTNMGKKGKDRIEKFFSIDKMINDTYEVYEEILK